MAGTERDHMASLLHRSHVLIVDNQVTLPSFNIQVAHGLASGPFCAL